MALALVAGLSIQWMVDERLKLPEVGSTSDQAGDISIEKA
jgi:hypothetical protein